jgi:hypothetical protein
MRLKLNFHKYKHYCHSTVAALLRVKILQNRSELVTIIRICAS